MIDLEHDNFIIVLQYANQGNLKINFTSLKWENTIQIVLDIAYLQITHQNLINHNLHFSIAIQYILLDLK
jgi:hypothetical protein